MDYQSIIKRPIVGELEKFNELFNSSLSSSEPLLSEVLGYVRQKNGKRMRPILILLTAKAFGEITESTLHTAVALEVLHTASLIHDDVVDESNQRRGQQSVNATYDNKISVLVGDFLLAISLLHAGKTCDNSIILTISELGCRLAEGEILQLSSIHDKGFSEKVYFDVIGKKTAALFSACTRAAALSVSALEREVKAAEMFGEYVGICFQIKDDIFDYFDNSALGKPTGNDMKEGKLTLPVLYVLNQLNDPQLSELALKVRVGEASSGEINRLVEITKANGGIEYAQKIMDSYKAKAVELLDISSNPEIKAALSAYLDFIINRPY